MGIGRIEALKRFFSTPDKPVETKEIMELAKADRKSYIELSDAAAKALGVTIEVKQ